MKLSFKIVALAALAMSAAACAETYGSYSGGQDRYGADHGGTAYNDQRWRQRYQRTYNYTDDTFYQQCRNGPDPAAVIAGGLIGGLVGHSVSRGGGQTGGTIAGVVVGAAIGAALTNNMDCEDRSYAYRSYYDGFNSNRPNSDYEWRNERNGHNGRFHVDQYYDDPDGFHCATYRQTVNVDGRQRDSQGHACRQPNGSWAIVD